MLRSFLLLLALGTSPSGGMSQVTDLTVTETDEDAQLAWSTGAAPYRVFRSTSPDFYFGNHVVAGSTPSSSVADPDALRPGSHSYYYAVYVDGQPNPPGIGANPPPPAAPEITSITPSSGKPGDAVTIMGNNFMADGSRMIVTFHHAIAEIVNASDTAIDAIVPEGALTGDVLVCIASNNCSSPFPFAITFGPTFIELSSVAFESGTGSLWIADRGAPNTVYELDSSGALLARGSIANPVLAHPSPGDGNGRIYYGNSTVSTFNQGTIEFIDSATNAKGFLANAGEPKTDPAACFGIAANDLEPNVAYFLNGIGGGGGMHVRRVLFGPGDDPSYGNQPFDFNDPAGARFDSSGNLYITSTTEIYKILPGEAGVELVAGGFSAAAGIDLVETGEETLIAVADEAAGEVWLVKPGSGVKVLVEDGLTGPVGVAFADDPAIGKTGLYVAEPTRILLLPDPRMEFLIDSGQKIWLSKSWSYDVYPSPDQTADGEIAVRVRLTPLLDPDGRTAHFRLVDPKDPSLYIQGASDGDNLPSSPGGGITSQAAFDANGVAVATLTVNNQHTGNNYRVEAGLAGGGDFRSLAVSPVFTSWRRAYIEHDLMWRLGAWVVADSGSGQPNPMRVFVSDPSGFTVGEDVQILSGASLDTASGEFGTVAAIGPDYVDVDTDPGPGQAGLSRLYPGAAPDTAPYSYLARVGPGWFGADPNTAALAEAFDDAFAEWAVLPTGGFVPNFPLVPAGAAAAGAYIDARSPLFFAAHVDPSSPPITNTVHQVSGASSGDSLAWTLPATGSNWTWLFDQNIASAYPTNFDAARQSTLAHELAHQYDVNPGDPLGHDLEASWTPSGQLCLMNVNRDRTLGVIKMHAPLGAATNDLTCVRSHIDDLDSSSLCSQP